MCYMYYICILCDVLWTVCSSALLSLIKNSHTSVMRLTEFLAVAAEPIIFKLVPLIRTSLKLLRSFSFCLEMEEPLRWKLG
jgi:hypothetical protein